MPVDTDIRLISRDKLFAIFKSEELVRLFESILYAVRNTIPSDTTSVQAALDAHIADLTDAHQAGAIGFTPSGGLTANNVQDAVIELNAEKQPLDAMLTALAGLVTAADRLLYFTGADAPALATLTAFARTLLAGANAAAMRGTLGLGSIATQGAGAVAITGGAVDDVTSDGATLTNVTIDSGDVLLAAGAFGYAAGNGGTVAQATSKSTGVTLNKPSGEITLNTAALAAGAAVSFTLTSSSIAAGDRIAINHMSGGTFGAYHVDARSAAGSASIVVRNLTAGSLSEAIVLGFTVLKSATA